MGNIIVDHCSASWGNDQTLDTYRHMYQPTNGGPSLKLPTVNDTIQWCIITEALNITIMPSAATGAGGTRAFITIFWPATPAATRASP